MVVGAKAKFLCVVLSFSGLFCFAMHQDHMSDSSDSDMSEADGLDTPFTDFKKMRLVAAKPTDERFFRRVAETLPVPAEFVALMDFCRMVKIAQVFTEIHHITEFPFCCIVGGCKRPMKKLIINRNKPAVNPRTHMLETPQSSMTRMTKGGIDIKNYAFNNYMSAFDFTNVVVDFVCGAASTYKQLLFNSIVAKMWLNNGMFFALVCVTYTFLKKSAGRRQLPSLVKLVTEYLCSFASCDGVRKALLASVLDPDNFDAHLFLVAVVIVWMLNGERQCRTGYNIGSFGKQDPWKGKGVEYYTEKKLVKRKRKKREVNYQQPYLDGQWIPQKFTLALSRLVQLHMQLENQTPFEFLASVAETVGPFVGMQIGNTCARVSASASIPACSVFSRLLERRAVFPGPGTRKLMGLGKESQDGTGSRLISTCSKKDELVCGAVFAELGEQWGSSSKKLLAMLDIEHLHSSGFAEESICCEISANLHRTRKRHRASHWDPPIKNTFGKFLREFFDQRRKLLWKAQKKRQVFQVD